MTPTRREQKRQDTYEDIKACARELMRQHGTAGITIRGITRTMGFSATALYRYYENLDALITDLIVDAFNGIADAIEQSPDAQAPAMGRFWQAWRAYRQWALDYRVQFELIYGNPIPGYEAPQSITVPASTRTLQITTTHLVEAMQVGACTPSNHIASSSIADHLTQILMNMGALTHDAITNAYIEQALYLNLHVWSRIHGIVILEVFGHLPSTVGNMGDFFEASLVQIAREIGASPADIPPP